jgi:aconitate hydratase
VRANYLASPPLVVAYALAGSVYVNLETEPLGKGSDGQDVYLRDIWPSNAEIEQMVRQAVTPEMFARRYADVFKGDAHWQGIKVGAGRTYGWDSNSTYVQNPPYFEGMSMTPKAPGDVTEARVLGLFGDSITTDHISPAGSIKKVSPAGAYLTEHRVPQAEFNSYGARRGNHEVMMRGTFANIRIKNQMVKNDDGTVVEGGYTVHQPSGERMFIYDAAMRYQQEGKPLVIFAGKEYGTGSSRDWAAKGTTLLGVRAVVAESFERIHRSNLIGMGVLPLQFVDGQSWTGLGLTGEERVSIANVATLGPRQKVTLQITRASGKIDAVEVQCRIDTENEVEYFRNGGILHYVLRGLARSA